MGVTPDEKQLSVSGQNWGGIDIDGNLGDFLFIILKYAKFDFNVCYSCLCRKHANLYGWFKASI